jgi:hypothetical protein
VAMAYEENRTPLRNLLVVIDSDSYF